MNRKLIAVVIFAAFAIVIRVPVATAHTTADEPAPGFEATYDPVINPADFTTDITNPYFTLPVGKKMVFTARTEDGVERIEVTVPGWTREVMGVQTLVFWDRVYLNGELAEDTRDYLAQHKDTGDLWYFGEHVDNYENGKILDHHGAWLAGVDGAKPGIWMLFDPHVGDEFRNEYYAGQAEDMSKIVSIKETVDVAAGKFENCVKTLDSSPLFSATANKYYCQDVGGTALEIDLPSSDLLAEQRSELVDVDVDGAINILLPAAYAQEGVISDTGLLSSTASVEDQNDEGNTGGMIILAGAIGLTLGFLLQRIVIGKKA